jgi:non-heme Fe2+,alpha-ketoglutarate-dependent halogenase
MRLEWRDYSLPGSESGARPGDDESGRLVIDTDADPRDLSFRKSDPVRATTLAPEQVDRFNSDGFLAPLPVFDDAELTRMRNYIDDLVTKVVEAPDPRNAYSIINYQLVCRGLYEIIKNPTILSYARDILGDDFVCWNTHLFYKSPHDPKAVPFHQDAVYWPLSPSRTVTVWIAIDDADEDNGAVEFVPGSHLLGPLDHEQRSLDGTRALKREAVGVPAGGPRYTNVLRAGQVSLHSDLLLHGSPANTSGRRRAGLTLRYASADVRPVPGAEWYVYATTHCGGDVPAHWPNRRRPSSEHPELLSHLWGDFDGNTYSRRR